MASRFWVLGSSNWDAATTTNWAATSGGAGGASVPTSADDVTFDTLSNAVAYTVTVTATANCLTLTIGAPLSGNLTFAGSAAINVFGSFSAYSGLIRTYTGAIGFVATATGKLLTFGVTWASAMTWAGVGGGWTFQDALSTTTVTLTNGALVTNDKAVTTSGAFTIGSVATLRSINLGASTITVGGVWDATTLTNATVTAGTSILKLASTFIAGFTGPSSTYYDVRLERVGASQNVTGTLTCTNFTRVLATGYSFIDFNANIVVTGTLTLSGNSASTQRLYVKSDTVGTARTITCAGTVVLTNVDFEDITAAGGAAGWGTGTSIGNCGGNSGITFDTPINVFWNDDATASHPITDALWFTTTGGAVAARFPLPQDAAFFDLNSFGSAGRTITIGIANLRLPALNWTGVTNAPTFSVNAAYVIYGSLTYSAGVTITGASSRTFAGRGAFTLTSAGMSFGGPVIVRPVTGTLTLQDAFTSTSTLAVNSGTLSSAFNITATTYTIAAGATHTQSAGTIAITSSGAIWTASATSTINFTGSLILINDATATVKTFSGGGKTYGNIQLSGAGTGTFDFTGNNTFNDFKVDTPPHTIRFTAGSTTTVTTFTVNGTAGNLITLQGITAANWNLVKAGGGTITVNYLSITNSQASPPNTWRALNSVNGGSNTGWAFGTVANSGAYRAAVLLDGPSLYLRLDEASGTVAADSSGNALDGTYVGAPTLGVTGAIVTSNDTAVTLNGTTQYITDPDNALLDPGDIFSLEFWYNAVATGAVDGLMDKGNNGYAVQTDAAGHIVLVKQGVSTIVTSLTIPTVGFWTHVVVTKSGVTSRIYLNGVDQSGAVTNATIVATADALLIGIGTGPANPFAGSMDEVALYPTALSAAQVLAHYNAAAMGTPVGGAGGSLLLLGVGH